jgi:hypothetical protein
MQESHISTHEQTKVESESRHGKDDAGVKLADVGYVTVDPLFVI